MNETTIVIIMKNLFQYTNALTLIFAFLLFSCSSDDLKPVSSTEKIDPPQKTTEEPSVVLCKALAQKFDKILGTAKNTCNKDDDCKVYKAGVGKNCGGVTDKQTAEKLASITEEFFKLKCSYSVRCKARKVPKPVCKSGICIGTRGRK